MNNLPKKIYLLHGWAIDQHNANKWQKMQDDLKKRNVDSQFLAIPGLSTDHEHVWGLGDYVNWLAQTLPQKPVILLGHSFGGQLAIRFASQYPERVLALILLNSAGIRNNKPLAYLKRKIFYYLAKIGKLFFRAKIWQKYLYKLAREKDYYNAPTNMRQTMAKVIADEVKTDLPKIHCPTLIIWGKKDKITPLWMGQIMNSKISNSQLKIIDDARHSPQFTHGQEVVELVGEFMEKI